MEEMEAQKAGTLCRILERIKFTVAQGPLEQRLSALEAQLMAPADAWATGNGGDGYEDDDDDDGTIEHVTMRSGSMQ